MAPTGRGLLDPRAVDILHEVGDWMALNERSIRGCGASEFSAPADCRYTQRGDRLYLHLFAWPYRHLHLPGLASRGEYAQFLHDASEVRMQVIDSGQQAQNTRMPGLPAGTLTLELPTVEPLVSLPVIELFLSR